MRTKRQPPLYQRIREILESARAGVARSVNTTQVVANWLVGREIVKEEQKGKAKARYGERLLEELSERLQVDFGNGYSIQNLRYIRQLYLTYPNFIDELQIRHALRDELITPKAKGSKIRHAVRGELAVQGTTEESEKGHTLRDQFTSSKVAMRSEEKGTRTFS